MTFDTFVEIFDKKLIYECELYLQPQIKFVCDNSKNIIVNTILKFENPEDINKYLNNVYNSNIDIPHEKNNKKKDIQLTEKQKEKIYNFYIDDFLKFSYDK
jgi:chondroitin 4-sulfotransferase 11